MTGRSRESSGTARFAWGIWLPLAGVVAWEIASRNKAYAYGFAPPLVVARSLWQVTLNGELAGCLLASMQRMMAALAMGASAGLVLGGGLAVSTTLDRVMGPAFHALRQVPHLGLAPLMGLWFGTGDAAKVILVFLAVLYPVMLSTYQGVRAIDPRYVEVARVLRLSRGCMVRRLLLPAVAPYVCSGLAQAIPFAWIATVGSELLLRSGNGIGTMMQLAETSGRSDLVLVCTLSIGAASLLIDRTLSAALRRATPWLNLSNRS